MTATRSLALASLLASCGALQLAARPHVVARARPVRALAAETPEETAEEPEQTEEQKARMAAIAEAEAADPLMQAAGGNSDFVRWYRFEQAKEEYLKENPTDLLANAYEKLKGPVSSLVIITLGFYAIPLVRGIADGVREGDIFGTLSASLSDPTASLKF